MNAGGNHDYSTSGIDMEFKDKITGDFLFVEMHTVRSITM